MKMQTSVEERETEGRLSRHSIVSDWQLWVGIAISLGSLFLALRDVDLSQLVAALRQTEAGPLGLAVLSAMATPLAKAARWRLLLPQPHRTPLIRCFSILSIGLMVNAFAPARLGEVARVYLMGEAEAESKAYIAGSIVLEKVLDLVFLVLALILLFSQMVLPKWLADSWWSSIAGAGIALLFILLLVAQTDWALRIVEWFSRVIPSTVWRERLVRQAYLGLSSLSKLRQPSTMGRLIGWSFLVWVLGALTNYLIFVSMSLSLSAWIALLLLVTLQIGVAVPSSPGRVGIFHYLTILSLTPFGIVNDVALGYGIVLHLVVYGSIALLGIWGLWREKKTWKKSVQVIARLSGK